MIRLCLLVICLMPGDRAWSDEISLPEEISHECARGSVTMKLTGYATRHALGRNIYLVASYCENNAALRSAKDVLAFPGVKQLRIRVLRNVPSVVMVAMIARSLTAYDHEGNLGPEIARIEAYLRERPLKIDDEIILTGLEGRALSCQVNEATPIVVEKAALVHVVWSIYFGDPAYHGKTMPVRLTRLIAHPPNQPLHPDPPQSP